MMYGTGLECLHSNAFIIVSVRGFINWENSTETKQERKINSSKLKYHVKCVPVLVTAM